MMQAYTDYPQVHYPHHHHHHHHLTQDPSQNFTHGFSRGSSSSFAYPHQDYPYFVDRGGELASRLCPPSLVNNNSLDATGIGFAGNPPSFVVPEDISVYNQWDWSQQQQQQQPCSPAPIYPQAAFSVKSSAGNAAVVCSPTAQLPTPAAMAVLLNPNAQLADTQATAADFEGHMSGTARPVVRPVEPVVAVHGVPDSPSREKKHACTMCHKRFDRPSTLRKHLLVHTGEKAFVCDTCGRRFGVASNLNRHVKRCILKPVNSPSISHKSTSSGSPPPPVISPTSTPNPSSVSISRTGRRARVISPAADGASSSSSCAIAQSPLNAMPASTTTPKPPGQKRRRRAPSPSQWIPGTLQNFNLQSEDSFRATTVPLPPVRRNLPREERSSWDENVDHTPYHPSGWSGTLPGPGFGQGIGLGGKDMRNMSYGGKTGGFMLGRVLVF